MKPIKIIVFLIIFVGLQNIYANETSIDNLDIKVRSSVEIDLVSDYQINTPNIQVAEKNNLKMISGQDLLLKYNFYNNLSYSFKIDFWFDYVLEEFSEFDFLLLEEVAFKEDCIDKGRILRYNNTDVKIQKDNKEHFLCVIKDLKDLSKISFKLKPEENNKYFLLRSTPRILDKEGRRYNLNSFVDIQKQQMFAEDTEETEDTERIIREEDNVTLNPNFQDNNKSNLENSQNIEGLLEKTNNIKSGITGFVTLGLSPLAVIFIGLILVVGLALLITKKNKKFDNIDDLNRL